MILIEKNKHKNVIAEVKSAKPVMPMDDGIPGMM
jgi:hypothetical protein